MRKQGSWSAKIWLGSSQEHWRDGVMIVLVHDSLERQPLQDPSMSLCSFVGFPYLLSSVSQRLDSLSSLYDPSFPFLDIPPSFTEQPVSS